jgi:hypothetical protein
MIAMIQAGRPVAVRVADRTGRLSAAGGVVVVLLLLVLLLQGGSPVAPGGLDGAL